LALLVSCAEPSLPAGSKPATVCPVPPERRPDVSQLTYEGLYHFAMENADSVRSGYQFLACMPPELFSLYTLIHDSQSLQPASKRRPRVLLFQTETNLLMAFTTEGLPDGSRELLASEVPPMDFEVVQQRDRPSYQRPHNRFDYYRLAYDEHGLTAVAPDHPNPVTCLGCHQSRERPRRGLTDDPRPNWERYSDWPGAYASNDDFSSLSFLALYEQGFADFAAERDALLRRGEGGTDVEQYRERLALLDLLTAEHNPWPLSLLDLGQYRILPLLRTNLRHNIRVTQYLGNLNFRRLARLMRSHPEWEQRKSALIALLFNCGQLYTLDPGQDRFREYVRSSFDYVADWSMGFRSPEEFRLPDRWHLNLLAAIAEEDPALGIPITPGIVADHYSTGASRYPAWTEQQIGAFCAGRSPQIGTGGQSD
jgi:hypothetical protein